MRNHSTDAQQIRVGHAWQEEGGMSIVPICSRK